MASKSQRFGTLPEPSPFVTSTFSIPAVPNALECILGRADSPDIVCDNAHPISVIGRRFGLHVGLDVNR